MTRFAYDAAEQLAASINKTMNRLAVEADLPPLEWMLGSKGRSLTAQVPGAGAAAAAERWLEAAFMWQLDVEEQRTGWKAWTLVIGGQNVSLRALTDPVAGSGT